MYSPKNNYNKEEILACSRGKLFGEGNAQLPAAPMLMFDGITSITDTGGEYGKGEIKAFMDITDNMWFFKCHFINDPVMPGCLGLDAMWQLLGFYLGWSGGEGRGRALGAGKVKFYGQVLSSVKKIEYLIKIRRVIKRKLFLGIADAHLYADGKEIYSAKDLRVGLFKDTTMF